ncbi:hypothetical protein MMC24_001770 [Lignoscripta atroalba]|nr:hypothetical protein [Lignoscripta atroalba]
MAAHSSMSFLLPLPAPRPSFVQGFLRRIATTSHSRQEAPLPSKPSSVPSSLQPLPYHVHRTASKELPVYHLAKRGGNLHQTRIRKIEGNIMDLRKDIQQALGLNEEHIVVNQLTRHIIIKVRQSSPDYGEMLGSSSRCIQGWMKAEVDKFLKEKHF